MNFIDRIATHKAAAVVVLVVSSFLLFSMGGGIVAAPLTLPLLYLVARRQAGGLHVWAAIVAMLTAAEVGWALFYVAVGEVQPLIWLVPLAAAAGTLIAFCRRTPEAKPAQPSLL